MTTAASGEFTRLKVLCSEPPVYGANVSTEAYVREGLRLLRTTDITKEGELVSAGGTFVDPATIEPHHLLAPGDLLVSRSGTVGRAAIWSARGEEATHAAYLVRFRFRQGVDPRFVWYSTQSKGFTDQVAKSTIESTIGNLNASRIGDLRMPVPDVERQRRVVSFLDHKIPRIDALIGKKRHLLELIAAKQRRDTQALLLRERHIAIRLKFLAKFITSGSRGWAKFYDAESGASFLRVGNMRRDWIDLDLANVQLVVPPRGPESERTRAIAGDVLISITANVGAVGVVPQEIGEAFISQHLALVRLDPSKCEARYVALSLSTEVCQRQFRSALYGGSKDGLALHDVLNVYLPCPSLEDQRTLVREAIEVRNKSQTLPDRIAETLTELQEYRSAVITAAVTGQIDVRHKVA